MGNALPCFINLRGNYVKNDEKKVRETPRKKCEKPFIDFFHIHFFSWIQVAGLDLKNQNVYFVLQNLVRSSKTKTTINKILQHYAQRMR